MKIVLENCSLQGICIHLTQKTCNQVQSTHATLKNKNKTLTLWEILKEAWCMKSIENNLKEIILPMLLACVLREGCSAEVSKC